MSNRDTRLTHIHCFSTSDTGKGHAVGIRLRCDFPGKTPLVSPVGNLRRGPALLTENHLLPSKRPLEPRRSNNTPDTPAAQGETASP